ncbi:MAG: pyridoxamine 5'-phosphate oxidase family protein [Pseudomonadales bacterium]
MSKLSQPQELEAFLKETRLAMLLTNRADNAPIGVPVWFDWTGSAVEMFAAKNSAKIRRIQADPLVSVLVTNRVGEPEGWVAFDGRCEILHDGAGLLIERLGSRYWDLANAELKNTLQNWVAAEASFVRLRVQPERTRVGH